MAGVKSVESRSELRPAHCPNLPQPVIQPMRPGDPVHVGMIEAKIKRRKILGDL